MAKLPSKYDLSQQPSGRSGRQLAEYNTSGLGRGLQSLGNSLSVMADDIKRQQNTVDVARAEAAKAKGFIDTENEFSQDGDYSTFNKRAPARTGGVVDNAANLIRDPAMRERWKIGAQTDAARVNDAIGDKARTLGKQAETVAFDDALETNRRIYVDPNSSEEARAKARADIEGAISTGEKSGLLTPDQGAARRDKFVKGADFNRAKLEAERNPDQFRPGNVVDRIIGVESGGNATAKNPNSSATGAGQFIDSTWLATAKSHRPDLFNGRTTAEVLALRNDKALSREMTAYLANDNAQFLRNQGVQPTDGDIYLAHFLGPRGAAQVLKADPGMSVANIVGQDAVNANPFLKGMTANDVRTWANRKMGSEAPAYFKNLSPEEQQVVYNQAETRRREIAVEQRGNIETVVQNAPVAVQNTGTYDGSIPTRDQFMDAYGPQDGNERYDKFQAAMDVGQQAFNFRTMSTDDIQSMVNEAKPTSSGNDAALQEARYNALSKAATATLTARKSDPATYTQQAFPVVAQAWSSASETGNYQAAMNATAAAQQQLGIRDMKLLPKAVADQAVTSFKNPNATDDQRLGAVSSLIFSTEDQGQRQAVFNQLVDAGLPAMTEGAIEAAARGDSGAANRLLQAALTDTGKLPKAGDVKPADIDDALYSSVWAPGAVGDASYGVAYGDAASLERAQRGGELMKKAVQLRISQGQDLETAVSGASKDLFGDVKVYDGSYGVNANLPVPSDTDDDALYNGLNSAKTSFKAALELQRQRIIGSGDVAPAPTGEIKGLVQAGNIDLSKRPVVKNEDGSISTVRSMSFNEDGKEILVPTVSPDGKLLTDDEAIDLYRRTGQNLGVFKDASAADAYAKALHDAQDKYYSRSTGQKAVLEQSTQNRIDDILENGVFVTSGNGIGLRDPYTGQFVPGEDGVTPLSIPLETVLDLGSSAPARTAPDFAPTPQNTQRTQQEIDTETYGSFAPLLNDMNNGVGGP